MIESITIDDIDYEITFAYTPGHPAKLDGSWEDCYPEEMAEVEIESIQIGEYEVLDVLNETTIKKIEDYILENAK